MKPNRFASALALLLMGCASGHPLDCATGLIAWNDCAPGSAGYEKRMRMEAGDDATCQSYGAKPGTPAYVNCRTMLSMHHDDVNQATLRAVIANTPHPLVTPPPPPPQTTNCISNVVGNSVYTNCH